VLFNSFDFGFFLVLVYLLYWGIGTKRKTFQNLLLLISSYFFYGIWDWRFLALLVSSSLIDFIAGKYIAKSQYIYSRRLWLAFSLIWNLGVLISFKYFNFFLDSFSDLFSLDQSGDSFTIWTVIVPLGLSFYTFQTMSYTIDVYRKKIEPTDNLLRFLCFVSFFPQLVAGPIERAKNLLPQFSRKRSFDVQNSKEGLRQILWGLFKKILVADKLGLVVTIVFNSPEEYGFLMLIFGAILFCFQVYCDFSGYTDIAIGTARLFGFKLSKNFNLPYLAKNLTNFWQRWHITLTRWFTDYVYAPFVKSTKRASALWRAVGLVVTMLLVGLWHGANLTFIAFGLFNGVILVVERASFGANRYSLRKALGNLPRPISLIYIFLVFTISSVFFRAENLDKAWLILKRIFTFQLDTHITSLIGIKLVYLLIMITAEVLTRKKDFPLQNLEQYAPRAVRWILYYIMIALLIRYVEGAETFIYFQF